MNEERTNNRKSEVFLSLIGVFILLLAVLGISYAVWSKSFKGTKENSLTTGNVSFTYSEAENSYILIENAIPISDRQGKKLNGERNVFDFNVSTTSSNTIKYDIFAEPVGKNTLPEKSLKIYLTDQKDNPVEGYNGETVPLYSDLKNYNYNGNNKNKLIYSSHLTNGNKNKKYRLRIWLSSDSNNGENQLKFSFKVNVKGSM